MAIAIDATGTAQRDDSGGTSGVLTGSITIGTLTNGILIVCSNIFEAATSVRLDSSSGSLFTQIGTTQTNSVDREAQAWYLLNPPSGSHSIYVAGPYVMGAVIMSSWSGVDQTTPIFTNTGSTFSGTSTTLTITNTTGGVAIDCLATKDTTPTPTKDANGTLIGLLNNASSTHWAGSQYWVHDGSTTLSWGSVPSSFSAYALFGLNPASGGGGGSTVTYPQLERGIRGFERGLALS